MNHMTRVPRAATLGNHEYGVLSDAERAAMIESVRVQVEGMFDALGVDHTQCHNTRDTPRRFAKMMVEETMRGRFSQPPSLTAFENAGACEDMIVTGPITVRSTCAHHLMPIYGEAYIGILPDAEGRIIGLSKYDRVVDHFAARLQIQEELVGQIADFLEAETKPKGIAVRISAVHMCKTHRGVRASHESRMVNTAWRGTMKERDNQSAFLAECGLTAR